ncbi:MAG: flagellar basal body rod protein FlgB [Mycobacteriales bacterium]
MTLFTDGVQSALERAMDGVALRQRVSAQNIANVMTPGYRAQQVSFEGDLASALADGADPAKTALTVTDAGGQANELGNSVDLATESTSLMKSGLQYEALVQATNYRLGVLREALR